MSAGSTRAVRAAGALANLCAGLLLCAAPTRAAAATPESLPTSRPATLPAAHLDEPASEPSSAPATRPAAEAAPDAPEPPTSAPGTGPAPRERRWHLEAHAGTVVPALVGAGVELELPYRLRASLSGGVLPGPYVDLINAIVIAVDGWDELTGELIKMALKSAATFHFDLGWYPFRRYGAYFALGMTIAALGGSATTAEIIETVTNTDVPMRMGVEGIQIRSTLYNVTFHLGYRFVIIDRIVIRAELGMLYTFASSSSIELERSNASFEMVNEAIDTYLNDLYTTYVIAPTIGVWAGYRFF